MAMYSFSLESFTAVACRSVSGSDVDWVIVTVNLGTRINDLVLATVGSNGEVNPGDVIGRSWSAGPYQALAGETGVVTYTIVNLSGMGADDQATVITRLGTSIATAVRSAAAPPVFPASPVVVPAPIEAAIRGVFGGAGELLGGPALGAGQMDCRGLVGVYVAPFVVANVPATDDVALSDPLTLTGTTPAACGTTPMSTAVFSVRRGPSLFSQSTPITVLASAPAVMETLAVGMDGLVRYNVRSGQGTFGAWQVVSGRTFSQSAPLVAVAGTAQRKDVFGTGTDGVIYRWTWTQAAGWGDWTALSTLGQFLPDTPVSAISLSGVLSLFAVDPDGVAQCMTWNGDTVRDPWGPIPGLVLVRRTPLLVMGYNPPWVEVYGISELDQDYHASRLGNVSLASGSPWGVWESIGGATAIIEPASRRNLGLSFDMFDGTGKVRSPGVTICRVDGSGNVNQIANGGSWIGRKAIPGLKTISAGSICGVRMGNQLLLYMVDGQTGRIGVASWSMPIPFNVNAPWSGWTLFPAGPALAKERQITAISTDDSHVELFVVDRQGVLQHVVEDTGPGGERGPRCSRASRRCRGWADLR